MLLFGLSDASAPTEVLAEALDLNDLPLALTKTKACAISSPSEAAPDIQPSTNSDSDPTRGTGLPEAPPRRAHDVSSFCFLQHHVRRTTCTNTTHHLLPMKSSKHLSGRRVRTLRRESRTHLDRVDRPFFSLISPMLRNSICRTSPERAGHAWYTDTN